MRCNRRTGSRVFRSKRRAAVERAGPDLAATIKANAQIQADLLRTASPVIAASVASGKLKVVPAYYDLATGAVTLLG